MLICEQMLDTHYKLEYNVTMLAYTATAKGESL